MLREGGKAETGLVIARIELVEQTIEAQQALIGVLRSEVHAVVVVPQGAHRLIDVAVRLVVRVESGQHVGIVLIAEVPGGVEVAGVAVAFRRRVPVVKMGGHRRKSKTGIIYLHDRGQ